MTHRQTLGLALFAASVACADLAAAATIGFDRSSVDALSPGDRVTLEILGSDFTDGTSGGGLDLSWNAAVLALAAADIELLFPSDQFFFDKGDLNATEGTLTNLSTVSLNAVATSSFKIARLTFTAIAGGTSLIGLRVGTLPAGPSDWATPGGEIIALSFEPAELTVVEPVPVPAALALMPGALALLGVRLRKKAQPAIV